MTLQTDEMRGSLIQRLEGPLPQRVTDIDTGEKADEFRLSVSDAERRGLLRLLRTAEGSTGFSFDAFEHATNIMARWLARFREEDAEPNANDRLTAGHLAGALAAQGLLVERADGEAADNG